MKWYRKASSDHGNTYDGQRITQERKRLAEVIANLKVLVQNRGPADVLPRFRTDVRRKVLLLPPLDRYEKMSMIELESIARVVAAIQEDMHRYSMKRIRKIEGS